MRISDWSSDVCSSDLADLDRVRGAVRLAAAGGAGGGDGRARVRARQLRRDRAVRSAWALSGMHRPAPALANACWGGRTWPLGIDWRTTMHRLPASPLAFLLVASLTGCASAPVADAPAQRYDLLVPHGDRQSVRSGTRVSGRVNPGG